jgi:hypothetical protein
MRLRLPSRALAAVTASIAGLAAVPAPAGADAVYHTEHMALEPVGDAPLRSGFVNNIKANGPTIYAHEVYVLTGAAPRASYTVTNHFFLGDPSCTDLDAEEAFETAVLRTNRAGNGRAGVVFVPADLGGATGGAGVYWTLESAAGGAYQTGCTTVTLD